MEPTKDPATPRLPLLLTPQGSRRAVAGAAAVRIPGGMHVITSAEHVEATDVDRSNLLQVARGELVRLRGRLEDKQTELERLEGIVEEVQAAGGRVLLELQDAKNDAIDLRTESKQLVAKYKELELTCGAAENDRAAANTRIKELEAELEARPSAE